MHCIAFAFVLQRGFVVLPSHGSSMHLVDDVSKEVQEQLEDLEGAAEGEAKPEGEAVNREVIFCVIIWIDNYPQVNILSNHCTVALRGSHGPTKPSRPPARLI